MIFGAHRLLEAIGTVYIGSNDNKLYAINSDGTLNWSYDGGSSIYSGVTIADNGILYFSSYSTTYALQTGTGAGLDNGPWPKFHRDLKNTGHVPAPEITLSSTTVSIAETDPDGAGGDVNTGTFTITNDGDLDLVVSSITSDNAALTVSPSSVTLTSGASQVVTITFEPTRSGSYSADITITSNDGDEGTATVTASGTGAPLWSYLTGGRVSFSAACLADDGTIYIGSQDDNLYAFNPDGSLKWSYATGGDLESSAAIASDGTVYAGSWDNNLYAVNQDGTLKWSYTTGSFIRSAPSIGSTGTIYFGV